MANQPKTKGSRRQRTNQFGADWQGFVTIPLNDDDRARIELIYEDRDVDLWVFVETLLTEGYKFSLTAHKGGESFIATATGKSPECANLGFSLSAFGPTPMGALSGLYYKIAVLTEWRRWADEPFTTRQQMTLWG